MSENSKIQIYDTLETMVSKLNKLQFIETPRVEEILNDDNNIMDLQDIVKSRAIAIKSNDAELKEFWGSEFYFDKAVIYHPNKTEIMITNISEIYHVLTPLLGDFKNSGFTLGKNQRTGIELCKDLTHRYVKVNDKGQIKHSGYSFDLTYINVKDTPFTKEANDDLLRIMYPGPAQELNRFFEYGVSVDLDLDNSFVDGKFMVKFLKLNANIDYSTEKECFDNKILVSNSLEYNFLGISEKIY